MYEQFFKITGYNLAKFLTDFTRFVSNNSQNIMDYYSGSLSTLDRKSYEIHKKLLKEVDYVLNIFDLNSERFNTIDFWVLMEFIDDIKIKLETISNFSKFARSSVKKDSFSNNVSIEVVTRDNETLEELISRLGSSDRDNDWAEIALSNMTIQEDYTIGGGKILNVNFKNNLNFTVNSILDNPEGEKIKGRDICRTISFEDEDLKVLGYNDTLIQTMGILLTLNKNDNPEFFTTGIDKTLVTGVSIKSIALPSLIRQIFQIFSTEDIVKQIQILETSTAHGTLSLNLNIIIKSGESQQQILSINGN